MSARTIAIFAGIGVVVALHWVTFYGAIKLSNASVAATCMGVAPIMMSIVEPWITRKRFDPRELLIGVAAIPGVMLVVGGTPQGMRLGIAAGVLSALLVSVFGSLNKRYVEHGEPMAVTGLELAAGTALLTLLALVFGGDSTQLLVPGMRDGLLLLLLALVCTLFPFALSLVALRNLSAFSAQLAVSLEPVYAVFLAMLLLNEQRELGLQFYAGLVIILGSVFAHAALKRA
jgi:drug/metabolite transporter (DMT)-like permease